jgi:hypothetical protein
MRRREFITALGGAAAPSLLWPLAARSQQRALPVIGYLSGDLPGPERANVAAFLRGLNETGYVKVATWRSNIGGRTVNPTACRRWRLTWFTVRSP